MPEAAGAILYSREFFAGQVDGSTRSAAVVVPLVLEIMSLRSLIDVGCGVGPWAAEFMVRGVPDVWGVDGDYVNRPQLRIPSDRFIAHDLTETIEIKRDFDLAVSLEVAEHLPQSRAEGFVYDLTRLARCILFSAAVPGPTGTGHINAQFLPYWIDLFRKQGYTALDPIRPKIWGNPDVEWFYQQDIIMFAAPNHPLLELDLPQPQSLIHQELYEQALNSIPTLGQMARFLPMALSNSVRYHLKHS